MWFKILEELEHAQIIAIGRSIREINRLRKVYGRGRWRKMKSLSTIQLPSGELCKAEIHWYEAHGVGRKEFKIKRIIEGNQHEKSKFS